MCFDVAAVVAAEAAAAAPRMPPLLPTMFEDPLAARLRFFFVTIEDLALGNLFLCVVFQVAVIIPDAIESVPRFLSYLDLLHMAEEDHAVFCLFDFCRLEWVLLHFVRVQVLKFFLVTLFILWRLVIGAAVVAAAVENIRSAAAEAAASCRTVIAAPAAKAAPEGRAPAAASRFGRIALKAKNTCT